MPGERPFFVVGVVAEIAVTHPFATINAPNGYYYHIHNDTPGIRFEDLRVGQRIQLEVTSMVVRVLSARILDSDAAECDGSTTGS
jgi:hypothetical protein